MAVRTWLRSQRRKGSLVRRVVGVPSSATDQQVGTADDYYLADTYIQHKFVFDTGRSFHPIEGASALLEAGVAEAAFDQTTGEVFTPSRYQAIQRLSSRYRRIIGAGLAADDGAFGLVRYAVKNPLVLIDLAIVKLRYRSNDDEDTDPAETQRSEEEPDDFFEWAESQIRRQGILAAILSHADSDNIAPEFVEDQHWIRLEMPTLIAERSSEHIEADATLFLHRSGIAVLTFHVWHDGRIGIGDALEAFSPRAAQFNRTSFPTVITDLAVQELDGSIAAPPSSVVVDGGLEIGTWAHDTERASTADVFEMYSSAIVQALRRTGTPRPARLQQWRSVPILVSRDPDPKILAEDRSARIAIGALALRLPVEASISEDSLAEASHAQLSTNNQVAIWANAGSAVLIHSPLFREELLERYGSVDDIPGQEYIRREQHLSGAYDLLLAIEWAPKVVKTTGDYTEPTKRAVTAANAAALAIESDLRRVNYFSPQIFRTLQENILAEMGTEQEWEMAHRRLAIATAEEERATSVRAEASQRRLQWLVALLTLVAGFPAIDLLVDAVADIAADSQARDIPIGSWIAQQAGDDPSASKIALFLLLFAIVVVVRLLPSRRQRRPLAQRRTEHPPRKRPHVYGGEHQFRFVEDDSPDQPH